jgi:hypothetical protein
MVLVAALLAIVLTAPSLFAGMAFDDFFQKLRAQGKDPFGHHPLDIFTFCWGPADVVKARETGIFPWFTQPQTRLAFLRPLASVTQYLDYTLWPQKPWLMHLQNLAWYGAAVALVAALYRRIVHREWVAGLAALMYAADDAHALPMAFLANRNAIMALVFGIGAVLMHDRWRRDGARRSAFLAPLSFTLALLCAEASLGALAYLISYAVFLESPDTRFRERVLSIAPYLLLVVGWQALARSFGYHVEGSSLYIDPAHEPLRFAKEAPVRAITLLLGQLLSPPSDVWHLVPRGPQLGIALFAGVVLLATARVVIPLLRRDAPTRFFVLGSFLALAPICATFQSDRLLLFVGVGAMAVVARVIGALADGEDANASASVRRVAKTLGVAWLASHLVLAPLCKPVVSHLPALARDFTEHSADSIDLGADASSQDVVILNAPNFLLAAYRWSVPREGVTLPRSGHVLSLSMDSVEVERIADDAIIVRTRAPFLAELSSKLFRSERSPLVLGDRVELGLLEAEVSEMGPRGLATGVTFRFSGEPGVARHRFVAWDGDRFVEVQLPSVGSRMRIGKDRPASLLPGDS